MTRRTKLPDYFILPRSQDLGAHTYPLATAINRHAPTQVGIHSLALDANGSMLTGLFGKTMAYDGENRPVSVSHQGDTTSYTYGPDGQRLKGRDLVGHDPLCRCG